VWPADGCPHRIPLTLDRGTEVAALDAYVDVLRRGPPDASALVFSCGTGAVRTTFGMVAASLVRRAQLAAAGAPLSSPLATPGSTTPMLRSGAATPTGPIGLGLPSELAGAATVGSAMRARCSC
jgi:hypothetical protein